MSILCLQLNFHLFPIFLRNSIHPRHVVWLEYNFTTSQVHHRHRHRRLHRYSEQSWVMAGPARPGWCLGRDRSWSREEERRRVEAALIFEQKIAKQMWKKKTKEGESLTVAKMFGVKSSQLLGCKHLDWPHRFIIPSAYINITRGWKLSLGKFWSFYFSHKYQLWAENVEPAWFELLTSDPG